MSNILTYQTDSGEVAIEIEKGPTYRGTRSAKESTETEKQLNSALAIIRRVGDAVIGQVKSIANRPSEVQVEVGLKFTAEAGVIVSKTSAEGNLKMVFTWKEPPKA